MDTHKITEWDWTEYMCGFRCPLCNEAITLTDAGDQSIDIFPSTERKEFRR